MTQAEGEMQPMNEHDWLAEQFEDRRSRLRGMAYRMLGSESEADDAVQEAWLRLSRSEAESIDNLGGWLTTVVTRVCLNMLRSRRTRREESLDSRIAEPMADGRDWTNPEQEALVVDLVGLALLVVLDTLTPDERIAFVLHDTFAVPFDEIAPIVGRSPAATRQLASRARRKVQGATTEEIANPDRRRQVVETFLAASRGGDFAALLALLDPDAVLRADEAAVQLGASAEVRGAPAVAKTFAGRARAAQPAFIDGMPGLIWFRDGRPRMVFAFTIADRKIMAIEMVADPDRLSRLDISAL